MNFIKKLLQMTYTREVFILFIAIIAMFCIHQTSVLFLAKIILDLSVTGLSGSFAFAHLENGKKNNKGFRSFLIFLSFAIILFSICGLIATIPGYLLDEESSYTKHYVYQPIQIVKDSNEIRVIGKTQILRSDKISDYISKDLKICKDERYSAVMIRLSDNVYICK